MFRILGLVIGLAFRLLRSRRELLLENLAQLAVLKPRTRRLKLTATDKLFWVAVRRLWSRLGTRTDSIYLRYGSPLAPSRIWYVGALPERSAGAAFA